MVISPRLVGFGFGVAAGPARRTPSSPAPWSTCRAPGTAARPRTTSCRLPQFLHPDGIAQQPATRSSGIDGSASRIGYRRSPSRRSIAWLVDRRPTVARNRRRSVGSIDRSSLWASSFSIAVVTPAGVVLLQILHRLAAGRCRLPAQILRHQPQMIRTSVCTLPYPSSTAGSRPSCFANLATATGGAAATSSGTNPSHGNVANATASPSL